MELKYQLLKNDYIDIRHPNNQKKPVVRLYRIISLKSIMTRMGEVKKYTIGGYVESEANLSQDDGSWIFHTGKVFDNAVVRDSSIVKDDAAVFENAVVTDSTIEHYAHVRGSAVIHNSRISDKSDVKGSPTIDGCTLKNSAMIYENATIKDTYVSGGGMIHGHAVVERSFINDVSEVRGDAELFECRLSGRHIVETGKHDGDSLHTEVVLNITTGTGEL